MQHWDLPALLCTPHTHTPYPSFPPSTLQPLEQSQTITEQKPQFYLPNPSLKEMEQSFIECNELCLSSGSTLPLSERGNGLETAFFPPLYFFPLPDEQSVN